MATCVRCNNTLSFFENVTHLTGSKVCSTCEQHINMTLGRLQQQIMQEAAQNQITEQFCTFVSQDLTANKIPPDRATSVVQLLQQQKRMLIERHINMTLSRIYQQIMQKAMQNEVTEQFCTTVYQDLTANNIPPDRATSVVQSLQRQKQLSTIRQGHLPLIRVNAILDTDEQAHFETLATYYKPNKQVKLIPGRMIATNKNLYFITSDRNSMKIDWNNVVHVSEGITTNAEERKVESVHIQVSKGSGGGHYQVVDRALTVAIIDTAVRLWKRHLVELKEHPNTQGIPDHVKATVFKRDEGKCRQCGYTGPYIEYDHILPRSKGGPNTVENIQLLCRQCNLKKGNRI